MAECRSKFQKISVLSLGLLLPLAFINCSPADFEMSQDLASVLTGNQGISDIFGNDPLNKYAWHLENKGQSNFAKNLNRSGIDLNIRQTIQKGYTGRGIKIVVSDDGVEDTHEDLNGNIHYGESYDFTIANAPVRNHAGPGGIADYHATPVAGIIAALANNGVGSRGVASEAKIISYNFLAEGSNTSSNTYLLKQLEGGHDIYNMSWGSVQNRLVGTVSGWENLLKEQTSTARNGKGSVYVKSSGNYNLVGCASNTKYACVGSSNFDGDNNNPYLILVGSMNGLGSPASYSSRGSNVWVSAFGGEYGDDYPAIVTPDRSGCLRGLANTSKGENGFEKGELAENSECSYTTIFNGTSAAAPMVSGAVALLIEANSNLNWRDIKYILAKTAKNYPLGNSSHPLRYDLPSSLVFDYGNKKNSAGFTFNNALGFGSIDVDAAIDMATKGYVSLFTSELTEVSAQKDYSTSLVIPNYSATGIESTIEIDDDILIEGVSVTLKIAHTKISQVAVDLISPANTVSRIIVPMNALDNIDKFDNRIFLSNAFFMEQGKGEWKIKVYDTHSSYSGGAFNGWSLKIHGQTP